MFKENDQVHIIKVDCTENGETCKQQGVKGYPTLILFENGEAIGKYDGGRTLNDLVEYLKKNMDEGEKEEDEEEEAEGEVVRGAYM